MLRSSLVAGAALVISVSAAHAQCEGGAAAVVVSITGDRDAAERQLPGEADWKPLPAGAVVCAGERLQVSGERTEIVLQPIGGNAVERITATDGPMEVQPASGQLSASGRLLEAVLTQIYDVAEEANMVGLVTRGAGDPLQFMTPDLETGGAMLSSDGYNGLLTIGWRGGYEPYRVEAVNADGETVMVVNEVGTPSGDRFMITEDIGGLEPGAYEIILTDAFGDVLTGEFQFTNTRPPRLADGGATELSLNFQTIVNSLWLAEEHSDDWSFQALQSFGQRYPDLDSRAFLNTFEAILAE